MTRKGLFPFEYVDNYSKVDNTSIPRKTDFYSQLNNNQFQMKTKHVLNVWNTFDCKNLGDYHDLYLRVDCLLPFSRYF